MSKNTSHQVFNKPHLVVVDPGVRQPEVSSYNRISLQSSIPTTLHLPALFGTQSLQLEQNNIKGIIVLGSASSVNEKTPWQLELGNWLLPLMKKGIPTFGICFGHQFIAHLFGGKVDYVFADQKKHLGFREVQLEANSLWGEAIKGWVAVSHGEHVSDCPLDFKVVGKSPEVPIDAMVHVSYPIWSFQFHPEALDSFLKLRGYSGPITENHFTFGHSILKRFIDHVTQG